MQGLEMKPHPPTMKSALRRIRFVAVGKTLNALVFLAALVVFVGGTVPARAQP
jgi:hypothetical protein